MILGQGQRRAFNGKGRKGLKRTGARRWNWCATRMVMTLRPVAILLGGDVSNFVVGRTPSPAITPRSMTTGASAYGVNCG